VNIGTVMPSGGSKVRMPTISVVTISLRVAPGSSGVTVCSSGRKPPSRVVAAMKTPPAQTIAR
jgi:hypothetical protein